MTTVVQTPTKAAKGAVVKREPGHSGVSWMRRPFLSFAVSGTHGGHRFVANLANQTLLSGGQGARLIAWRRSCADDARAQSGAKALSVRHEPEQLGLGESK